VTGANTGIGYETARVLALRGARVFLACRNEKLGKTAAAKIAQDSGNANVRFLALDLASFASVNAFVTEFKKLNLPLHILVLNAGVMAVPERRLTADGQELHMGVNHFGHFALTLGLTEELKRGAPARVVCVSALAYEWAPACGIDFDNLKWDRNYHKWSAYGMSKLANILFVQELNAHYRARGIQVTANSLHPGVIKTELSRDASLADLIGFFGLRELTKIWWTIKTTAQGAATSVFLATAPELEGSGGNFYSDCHLQPITRVTKEQQTAQASRLWQLSEEVTGVKLL